MEVSTLRQTIRQQRWALLLTLGLLVAVCLGIWLPVPFVLRLGAATLLAFFLPGWLLLQVLNLAMEDILEQLTVGIGLSYGLTVVIALGSLYLAGHLSTPLLIVVLGLTCLALIITRFLFSSSSSPQPMTFSLHSASYFLFPLLIAAFFSFTNLGYSDYWGDEMNGLLRAISAIAGRPESIFEHTKGPVEILLPGVFGLLVERFDPFTLRFPFALAYTVGVGGYYLLASRLFSRKLGLLAALVLVINGLYVAFGRIVQYQAVVFLMSSLSLLLAYRFYRGGYLNTSVESLSPIDKTSSSPAAGGDFRQGWDKYLTLSLFLFGVGLLAHFDMLLVLPAISFLIWGRYRWGWPTATRDWLRLVGAGLVLLIVTAIFYLPFFLNARAAETSSYLSRRIIGNSSWPSNNFDQLYMFAVMYNSRYYVIFIALLGLSVITGDLVRVLREHRQDKWLWLMGGITLILILLAVALGRVSLVPLLISLLLLGLLIRTPLISAELKMVYVWIGVSFIGYVFLVDHPRTHLRIIYPGWSLLVALAITGLATWLRARLANPARRRVLVGGAALLTLLIVIFAGYEYLLFVDREREYIFTYPGHKISLYWEDDDFPFGSRRLYGAPHRLGWQMIHQLYAQGELQGDWDSNDDGSNLFWYTLGAQRNTCYPRYYFHTQFRQREEDIESPSFNHADYEHIGQIWNNDRLQIDIYEFAPLAHTDEPRLRSEPARYDAWIGPADFYSLPFTETEPDIANRLPNPPIFRPSPGALEQIADRYDDPRIVNVRDTVSLIGYDLTETWAEPGGVLRLTLYWQAVEPVNLPYKIFVHLEDASSGSAQLWSQADDFPACGTQPTYRWTVGETVVDRHVLRLPAEMPPGDYLLRIGLYEPKTGLRMDLLDAMQNPQGNSVELTRITIRPAT